MRKAHETLNQCQKQNGWYKYDVSVSPRFRWCKSRNVQKERRVVQAWTGRGGLTEKFRMRQKIEMYTRWPSF